jgi:hypothetical protein
MAKPYYAALKARDLFKEPIPHIPGFCEERGREWPGGCLRSTFGIETKRS